MALTISDTGGGSFEQAPQGNHNATCYRLVDVGTHSETFEGETKQRHSIFISWELNDAKMEDGRPYTILKQYTLSLNEKSALYKDLCQWRKKPFTTEELQGFDLTKILGLTCELAIGETKTGNLWVDLPNFLQKKIDDSIEVKAKESKPSQKSEFESLDSMNQEKAFPSDEELADDEDESLPF
jgi:hypothetical protein